MIAKDRRNEYIQKIQFDMLHDAGILTPTKLEILLDAANWDGIGSLPKPNFSLEDEDDSSIDKNK